MPSARRATLPTVVLAIGLVVAACGDDGGAAGRDGCPVDAVHIVVSVGQWGDIVRDLAGDCGVVTTIISGTSVDPHDFEPAPADLAAFDDARLVMLNGLDYDSWAERAVDTLSPRPAVVDAGDVVGGSAGANPHLWYGPDYVSAVAEAIVAELESVEPTAASYFQQRANEWRAAMEPFFSQVSNLRAEIAGAKSYAATEPVFEYMAGAVGLSDETPPGFIRAAANEVDPSPGDIRDFEVALAGGGVDVLVFNTQTEGAVVDRLRSEAEAAGVPVVEVTESPPPDSTFVSWQITQLEALEEALAE